jgi:hypothetical protein
MTEGRRDPGDVALARVRAVEQAHEDVSEPGSPVVVPTSAGTVEIESLSAVGESVEVTVTGSTGGDPLFRIFNPPTLVPDPTGDREVNGIRFRYDPLAAVAQVIAQHGGAQSKEKEIRRGRR